MSLEGELEPTEVDTTSVETEGARDMRVRETRRNIAAHSRAAPRNETMRAEDGT